MKPFENIKTVSFLTLFFITFFFILFSFYRSLKENNEKIIFIQDSLSIKNEFLQKEIIKKDSIINNFSQEKK